MKHIVFEVKAAYNLENLAMPAPNGPNGSTTLSIQMLMDHALFWDWVTGQEAQQILTELYLFRTRLAQ
ncbi:MAG: hypothetical protein H7308_06285 [Chthonomonadaceae bacterium]|nr:hypothetical protein [Chthonomonadaceae bacterium]